MAHSYPVPLRLRSKTGKKDTAHAQAFPPARGPFRRLGRRTPHAAGVAGGAVWRVFYIPHGHIARSQWRKKVISSAPARRRGGQRPRRSAFADSEGEVRLPEGVCLSEQVEGPPEHGRAPPAVWL